MSAIKNILKLLLIFEDDKNVYTSQELSVEIGVSTRQIRNYIQELREFGYVIESDATRAGGYKSVGQYVDIPLKITIDELTQLGRMVDYLEKNQVFEDYLTIQNLYFKIRKYNKIHFDNDNLFDYRLQYQQIHEEMEKEVLNKVSSAIQSKNKLTINYFSAKNKSNDYRIIHPYKIMFYQGANYIHAFCEKAQDYRVFKVLRIRDITILDDVFHRNEIIERKLKNQNFGIFNEEPLSIKLEFKYPYNEFAKEIIIGGKQNTTVVDDNTTIIEATINNETELIGWLMSFGKGVKVISPSSLIDKIEEQAQEILDNYR